VRLDHLLSKESTQDVHASGSRGPNRRGTLRGASLRLALRHRSRGPGAAFVAAVLAVTVAVVRLRDRSSLAWLVPTGTTAVRFGQGGADPQSAIRASRANDRGGIEVSMRHGLPKPAAASATRSNMADSNSRGMVSGGVIRTTRSAFWT
jgi:hypothetical protein